MHIRSPGGLDRLELHDAPDPAAPGRGEIAVRIQALSLNYHDFLVVTAESRAPDMRIPMSDGAGEVIAVGDEVTEFAVGDAVISTFFPGWPSGRPPFADFATAPGDGVDGFARELVVASVSAFTHAPKGWTHCEAATLPCAALTAWRALIGDGYVKPGDVVLVQGTGGVSIFALQFAKAAGATVIATSSLDEKIGKLRELGADNCINYRETPNWGQLVLDFTGGEGVDHVIEIGGPGTLPESLIAARVGGHVSMIGVFTGREGVVPTGLLMRKQISLSGVLVGSRAQQIEMVRAIEANGIRPVIDSVFPFEQMADAFRHQESNRHFGKIVIRLEEKATA